MQSSLEGSPGTWPEGEQKQQVATEAVLEPGDLTSQRGIEMDSYNDRRWRKKPRKDKTASTCTPPHPSATASLPSSTSTDKGAHGSLSSSNSRIGYMHPPTTKAQAAYASSTTSFPSYSETTQFHSSGSNVNLGRTLAGSRGPTSKATAAALMFQEHQQQQKQEQQTRRDINFANTRPQGPGHSMFSRSLGQQRIEASHHFLQQALLMEWLRLQRYNNYLAQQQLEQEEILRQRRGAVAASSPSVTPVGSLSLDLHTSTSETVPVPSTAASSNYSAINTTKMHVRIFPSTSTLTNAGQLTVPVHNELRQDGSTEHGQQLSLPHILLLPEDTQVLSSYQCLLRKHIEAFEATPDDVKKHSCRRSKGISVGQVGIRCRHCKGETAKGSAYFPSNLLGLYQSSQNMALYHINAQNGSICNDMPMNEREEFHTLMSCKSTVGGGKSYWANAGRSIGLVDTPNGIRFLRGTR